MTFRRKVTSTKSTPVPPKEPRFGTSFSSDKDYPVTDAHLSRESMAKVSGSEPGEQGDEFSFYLFKKGYLGSGEYRSAEPETVMEKGIVVSIYLEYEDGVPVRSATIKYNGKSPSSYSLDDEAENAPGRFTFTMKKTETLEVEVEKPGFETVSETQTISGDEAVFRFTLRRVRKNE